MPTLYKTPEATFDYDNVILIPEECVVKSRSEVNVETTFGKHTFKLPVIPANMSTIVDENTCEWLAEKGYFYVMHRFDIDAVEFTKKMHNKNYYASISLGIKEIDYQTINRFVEENITPEYITVDVAHGDSKTVHKIVRTLKEKLPDSFIIAGNIASVEGAKRMIEAGADCLKVGVGPGCFTGEMLIKTSTGLTQIQNIKPGDEVLTHTGEYQPVTNKFVYENHDEILEINGIKCTPDHKFFVCNKKDSNLINENNYQEYCFWLEAKNINPEEHLTLTIED